MIWLIFIVPLIVGIVAVVLTTKRVEKGLLKKFMLTVGVSIIAFSVFGALHNIFYAVGVAVEHLEVVPGWDLELELEVEKALVTIGNLAEIGDVVSFFVALFGGLGFLVGLIGSIVIWVQKKNSVSVGQNQMNKRTDDMK